MAKNKKVILVVTLVVLLITLCTAVNGSDKKIRPQAAYGQVQFKYIFPLFLHQYAPMVSTSYYMTTTNTELAYNLGCELGNRDQKEYGAQDSVAVLSFGFPRCFDDGGFGANIYGWGPARLEDVRTAVKQFALGYYACTGTDNDSNLVIGVGTNNLPRSCDTEAKATAHGAAWAKMVHEINQWAVNKGIFHQVQIFGANNMELGWNTPAWTRAWIAGFEQVDGNFLLDFGDLAGCPYEDNPQWGCGTSSFREWTMEDAWYISYGAPSALPLPLIYLTTGVHAKQWAYLSQYSVKQHGYRMDFSGVFTQWTYCQQFGWCYMTDNTPDEAYNQLIHELAKIPETAQDLRWKTDIRWVMQNEIPDSSIHNFNFESNSVAHPVEMKINALESTLQIPSLSTALRSSIETKQINFQRMADMVNLSKINPAPKDSHSANISPGSSEDRVFTSGIVPDGEFPGLPYGVEITNTWQGLTEIGYSQIGAGSSPEDPQRGAVYITLNALDRTSFQSALVIAPEGCGPLTIIGEGDNFIHLQSSNMCNFTFDLLDWTLTQVPQ